MGITTTMDNMQLNVSQLLKEAIGATRQYEVEGTVDIEDGGRGSRVQGWVKLTRTNRSILVTGKLQMAVDVVCARCLSTFVCPLDLDIEEEYFPMLDISSGMSLPAPEEPSSFTIDEHQMLDLTEAVRQYAVIAIPMKPLCKPDCPGIASGLN